MMPSLLLFECNTNTITRHFGRKHCFYLNFDEGGMVVRIAKPALVAEHYALYVQSYGLKTRENQGELHKGGKTGGSRTRQECKISKAAA